MRRQIGSGRRAACGAALGLALLIGTAPAALADSPGAAQPLPAEQQTVDGGPGSQTDPHLSGSLVSYTADDGATSQIRYADLAGGPSGAVPTAGHRDSLSDVSGTLIVFRRVFTDGSSDRRPILVFDTAAPQLGVRELAPLPGARREAASIGGTTVAFVQQAGASSQTTDVCVADAADPDAPAGCLTTDGATTMNRDPEVSPDGSTVAFTKCLTTGLGCDVYVARRGVDGSWAAPLAVGGTDGEDIQPSTDGTVVVFASISGGDWDIRWTNVDGTGGDQLQLLGSNESNPRISGGLIGFEGEAAGATAADLHGYRPATGDLYRLTNSPDDETLHDLSVTPDGLLRMVWAQPDGLAPGDNDLHALRVQLPSEPSEQNEPPLLRLPEPATVNATGPDGATVTFEATASDPDGTATVTCEPASGATFPIGITTVACTATDDDGATATGSFDVTVRGAREQLADLLVAVTGAGPGRSLAAKIRAAVDRLPDRHLALACWPLQAFSQQIDAQAGRHIPADTAAGWIADATRIRAVLGCR